ncbi:hypothetical protein [Nocardia neocaledoniensis]|uniref:hypothetical protein n=1 Tax=Nocardia neocaledoniensis TaxID=236511 RepID=UPI002456465A|nr:hypothetical protein [Nocardia neocaledoniensis]
MRAVSLLGSAACAAIALAIALPTEASADPITDLLCNSGSSQFCPPPPPPPPPGGDCHASYDPCVPITSDVDCEGGSGNGPAYTGRVRVIGPDDYGLDDDNDGIGCETS